MTMAPRAVMVLLVLCAVGCAPAAQRSVPPPPVTARAVLPEAIRWVRASAEHHALFLQVFVAASARVRELAQGRERGTWAVILDADETVLDNSEYQRRRAAQGLGFTTETWDAWVREQKATALPGAGAFLRLVRELGGRIAIVTNRDDVVCAETRRNLEALALVSDVVLCRVKGLSDKNPRFEAVQRGTADPGLGPSRSSPGSATTFRTSRPCRRSFAVTAPRRSRRSGTAISCCRIRCTDLGSACPFRKRRRRRANPPHHARGNCVLTGPGPVKSQIPQGSRR
jgi:hypothetical protein